jgi:hypothetical protein
MAKVQKQIRIFKLKEKREALTWAKQAFASKVANGIDGRTALKQVKAEAANKFGIDLKSLWAIIEPILLELLKAWLSKVR